MCLFVCVVFFFWSESTAVLARCGLSSWRAPFEFGGVVDSRKLVLLNHRDRVCGFGVW